MNNKYLNIYQGGCLYTIIDLLEAKNEVIDNLIQSLGENYNKSRDILDKLSDAKLDIKLINNRNEELLVNLLGDDLDLDLDDINYLKKFIPKINDYTLEDFIKLLDNFEMTILNPYNEKYKPILTENIRIKKIFYDPELSKD